MLIVAYTPVAWMKSTSGPSLEGSLGGGGRPCVALARQPGDHRCQAGGVARVDQVLDHRERLVDPGRVERLALGREDLLRWRRLGPLAGVEQLLVDLLAGAAPDDLDRDLLVGLVPRQP